MRIAFIGNANNESFRIAHEISLMGAQCTVFPLNSQELDDPSSLAQLKYYALSPVIIDRSLTGIRFFQVLHHRLPDVHASVARSLNHYDFVVLNQLAPALFGPQLETPYASYLTGSDLVTWTNLEAAKVSISLKQRLFTLSRLRRAEDLTLQLVNQQCRGIQGSRFLILPPQGWSLSADEAASRIGVDGKHRRVWLAGFPFQSLTGDALEPRRGDRLVCLLGARLSIAHASSPTADFDDKGTLVFLEGWKHALDLGLLATLKLFRKGVGFPYVERFAADGNFSESLEWLDPRPYSDYVRLAASADVVIDSLAPGPIARIALDPLASGIPVVANFSADRQMATFGSLLPGLAHASSPESVAKALLGVQSLHERRRRVSGPLKSDLGASCEAISPRKQAREILHAALSEFSDG